MTRVGLRAQSIAHCYAWQSRGSCDGLYWHGRPTAFGMTLPDDLSVAVRVADVAGTGPAGLSAANELGLTTQVPGLTLVAVPRRPPSPLATVRFVDRAGRRARASQRLSPT